MNSKRLITDIFLAIGIAFIILFLSSCGDEDLTIEPKQYIIGKWETVEVGNWPVMNPNTPRGYTEFREDSTILYFDYQAQAYTSQATYWLADSILVEMYTRGDGVQLFSRRRYEFKRNRLRLDFTEILAQNSTEVLKKIK